MKRRIAFVSPRFGEEIVGGAEAVVRDVALGLVERGWDVEVLTTCAVSVKSAGLVLALTSAVSNSSVVARFFIRDTIFSPHLS